MPNCRKKVATYYIRRRDRIQVGLQTWAVPPRQRRKRTPTRPPGDPSDRPTAQGLPYTLLLYITVAHFGIWPAMRKTPSDSTVDRWNSQTRMKRRAISTIIGRASMQQVVLGSHRHIGPEVNDSPVSIGQAARRWHNWVAPLPSRSTERLCLWEGQVRHYARQNRSKTCRETIPDIHHTDRKVRLGTSSTNKQRWPHLWN